MLVCPLTVACGIEDLNKPDPPETESVLAELEAPTGSLRGMTPEESTEVLNEVSRGIDVLCGFDPLDDVECLRTGECRRCVALELFGDAVENVAASVQEGREPDGGTEPIRGVSGVLFVQRTCEGWGTRESNPAKGQINATIGFSGRGLDPVVWGTFDACRVVRLERRLQLDGEFFLDFEREAVPLDIVGQVPAVFFYTGPVRDDGLDVTLSLDAAVRLRLDRRGGMQLLTVGAEHGSFVWTLDDTGVSIETANGRHVCDAEEQRCVRQDS